MFTYGDWDGNLIETKIDNLDLRWELFLTRGQMFSVSGFYKRFIDPIELVRIPEQQTNTEYQARNVGEGSLYGVELEVRKDLDFISDALRNFNVSGNVTIVESFISMTEGEYSSRKSYERVGETIQDTRDMAGQAPYVINAGITYGSNDESGWDAGLFYNVKGSTLSIVGIGLYPDIYVSPFHSLNFSVLKQLGNGNTVIDFKAANLLNNRVESVFVSYEAEPQPYSIFNPGRSFSWTETQLLNWTFCYSFRIVFESCQGMHGSYKPMLNGHDDILNHLVLVIRVVLKLQVVAKDTGDPLPEEGSKSAFYVF